MISFLLEKSVCLFVSNGNMINFDIIDFDKIDFDIIDFWLHTTMWK